MNNIIKIFLRDLKNLVTHFFPLVIAIGICILPSLYAWFNIYSNWDPYANTSNIKIAVANLDEGYTQPDGTIENIGNGVVEGLKDNKSIGWVFVKSESEAVEGVKSGEYYAAVVLNNDFSSVMYNVFSQDFTNPTITYYENEKKNAVATKITDTAVATLKSNINEQFIQVAAKSIFEMTNEVSDDMTDSSEIDVFIASLTKINDNLIDYSKMIDSFLAANDDLSDQIASANEEIPGLSNSLSNTSDSVSNAKESLNSSNAALGDFGDDINTALNKIGKSIDAISTDIDNANLAKNAADTAGAIVQTQKDIDELANQLDAMGLSLKDITGDGIDTSWMDEDTKKKIEAAKEIITSLQEKADEIAEVVDGVQVEKVEADVSNIVQGNVNVVKQALYSCKKTLDNMESLYSDSLVPQLSNVLDSLEVSLDKAVDLMDDMRIMLNNMTFVFSGVDETMKGVDSSLTDVQQVITTVSGRFTEIINSLNGVSEDERYNTLIELLGGNPDDYSEFFSEPVTVNTETVYAISNYGSAVAPFYTVLALWVGALILVAIIKVKANDKDLIDVRMHHLFFGRYLMFFILGQLQAVIVVLGNIFLLHCQIEYPGLYMLTASLTSFTFTLLIYSLTLSFGDIGKAIAVVIMVIQIAGSGGTYPIEILPEFYKKVYIFFPFPYAINAFRETVAGMYEDAYIVYILEMLIFAVVALLIGLLIRIPFIGINHFVEKRMEDTKMM